MNPPILVLIPSKGRPHKLDECLSSLITTSSGLADFMVLTGGKTAVEAVNGAMPAIWQYDFIGIVCDDVRMRTPEWDRLVIDSFKDKTGLVYGWDGIQNDRLATHPFLLTEIPKRLGYIIPPCLKHYYGDNYFRDLLDPLGCVKYVPSLHMEHMHHSVGKSEHDQTYQRSEGYGNEDLRAYQEFCATKLAAARLEIAPIFR